MAGHSKYKTTKHRKQAQDQKKAKIFTSLLKEITVAVHLGGENPEFNARLRHALTQAKKHNVPNNSILRALKGGETS